MAQRDAVIAADARIGGGTARLVPEHPGVERQLPHIGDHHVGPAAGGDPVGPRPGNDPVEAGAGGRDRVVGALGLAHRCDAGDIRGVEGAIGVGHLLDHAEIGQDDVLARAGDAVGIALAERVAGLRLVARTGRVLLVSDRDQLRLQLAPHAEVDVEPVVAIDMVAPVPGMERVGPRATDDVVVKGAAGDQVVTLAAIGQDEASRARGVDHVIACCPHARGGEDAAGAVQIVGAGGVAVALLRGVAEDRQHAAVAAGLCARVERDAVVAAAAMQDGDRIRRGGAYGQRVVALAHQQFDHFEFAVGNSGIEQFEIRHAGGAHVQFQIIGAHAHAGDPGFGHAAGLAHGISRVEHHQAVGLLAFVGRRGDVGQGVVGLGRQFDARDHGAVGTRSDAAEDVERPADRIHPLRLRADLHGRLRVRFGRDTHRQVDGDRVHPVGVGKGHDAVVEPGIGRGRHQRAIGQHADAHIGGRGLRQDHLIAVGIARADDRVGPGLADQHLALVVVGDQDVDLRRLGIVDPGRGGAGGVDLDGQRLPLAILHVRVVDGCQGHVDGRHVARGEGDIGRVAAARRRKARVRRAERHVRAHVERIDHVARVRGLGQEQRDIGGRAALGHTQLRRVARDQHAVGVVVVDGDLDIGEPRGHRLGRADGRMAEHQIAGAFGHTVVGRLDIDRLPRGRVGKGQHLRAAIGAGRAQRNLARQGLRRARQLPVGGRGPRRRDREKHGRGDRLGHADAVFAIDPALFQHRQAGRVDLEQRRLAGGDVGAQALDEDLVIGRVVRQDRMVHDARRALDLVGDDVARHVARDDDRVGA